MSGPTFSYTACLRDMRRAHGVWGTAKRLAVGVYDLVRDSLPWRWRHRFGDLDFDWEEHVDTTWSNVGFGTRVREIFAGRAYQPTDPQIFREMMGQVRERLSGYTFIDLGSGKGRALLLAREYSFARIVGMELLPELHAVAQKNVRRLPAQERGRFELYCGDARQFVFPAGPLFVYLFDPFPAPLLAEVLAKLERSLEENPRTVLIGYQNPVSEQVIAASSRFQKLGGTGQWALFESVPSTGYRAQT